MTSRITAEMPPMPDGGGFGPPGGKGTALQMPAFLREPFSAAMSQSMLLPAFIALFGVAAALFMIGFTGSAPADDPGPRGDDSAGHRGGSEERTRRIRVRPSASADVPHDHRSGYLVGDDDAFHGFRDGFDDDDDYVEYTLTPARASAPERSRGAQACVDDGNTEPLPVHVEHPRPSPTDTWHSASVESWRSLLDDDDPAPEPDVEPIGFAHNGFHVDDEQRFRAIEEFTPPSPKPSRHERHDRFESPRANRHGDGVRHRPNQGGGTSRNRHYRADPDDSAGSGRHSF